MLFFLIYIYIYILHSVLVMVMGNGLHFYSNHSDNSCYGVMRNKMASCQQYDSDYVSSPVCKS